jgi:hypothetical protein
MGQWKSFIAKGLSDKAGNVLPIAAIAMLVAAAVVGSAVDISRSYRVKNRLQSACDAGVLAGRHAVSTNGFDSTASTAANNYFNVNFDEDTQGATGTKFTPTSSDNGVTVNGTASTTLSTLIMRLFGFNDFSLTVTCASSMGMGNADVMMVLDTTGSMTEALGSSTRIKALRDAMNNFYTTVKTATSGTNARVRYGFVPFSSTVNVGKLLYDLNPSYIADSHTYQSRQATYIEYGSPTSTSGPSYQNYSTSWWYYYDGVSYKNSSSCNAALPPNDSDYQDYGSPSTNTSGNPPVVTVTTTQEQRKATYQCYEQRWNKHYVIVQYATRDKVTSTAYAGASYTTTPSATAVFSHWTYMPVTYNTSVYKTFSAATTYTGSNGTAVTSTWAGCIQERQTVNTGSFSYSSVSGISPSGALDLDLDTAPTSSDSTKWKPLWPEVGYLRNSTSNPTLSNTSTGSAVSYGCPTTARKLAEMDATAYTTYVNSLKAEGSTYLDIGMIWGGRLISPTGIFQDNVNEAPTNGGEVSRHLIFMTDGEMAPWQYMQQAWGIEWWDRRVTTDGGYWNDVTGHNSRFRVACDAIKAKGIRVWVIAFTTSLSTDLTYCASTDSSFVAADAAELNAAFQEIANEVGELRVTS